MNEQNVEDSRIHLATIQELSMEFFRIKRDIPFMRYALIFNVISVITFLVAVGSLATRGLHLGVDFTGGTVMELNYQQPPDLDQIRERMVEDRLHRRRACRTSARRATC